MIFFQKLTFTICLKVLACAKLKKSCYCKKLCKKDTELFCSCNIHISISRLKSVKRVSLLFTSFCRIFPKITIFFGTYSPLIWKKLAQKRANSVFLFPSVEHQNTVHILGSYWAKPNGGLLARRLVRLGAKPMDVVTMKVWNSARLRLTLSPYEYWELSFVQTKNVGPCPALVLISQTSLTPHNYRWQNGKQYNRKTNCAQSALARKVRQGCSGPPLPHSTPT